MAHGVVFTLCGKNSLLQLFLHLLKNRWEFWREISLSQTHHLFSMVQHKQIPVLLFLQFNVVKFRQINHVFIVITRNVWRINTTLRLPHHLQHATTLPSKIYTKY